MILAPPPPTSCVLVFALSGLGKSTLCERFPDRTHDTDVALRQAIAGEYGDGLTDRELFRAWRAAARRPQRRDHRSPELARWARVRRSMIRDILAVLTGDRRVMVLTNMRKLPWAYSAYYGVELGRYRDHWQGLGRTPDNSQSEQDNTVLEGYHPLVRLPPGSFLGQRAEILEWLNSS